MEIERKWLIDREKLPYDLSQLEKKELEQCYISFTPVIRIRKVNGGKRYILTVKSAEAGISREEFELPLTAEQYDFLYQKHEGNVIWKTRYLKKEGEYTLEIDIFSGDLAGLCYQEVEFPDEESAGNYRTPDYAIKEVSRCEEYSNAALARKGRSFV